MRLVIISLIVCSAFTGQALAQESDAAKVASLKPRQISEARLELRPWREVQIHRAAQPGDDLNLGIYFHKPILALDVAVPPLEGWPRFVHEIKVRSEEVYLTFHVVASSPRIREIARQKVLKEDTEWLSVQRVDQSRVDVRAWPTNNILMQLVDRYSKEVLASGTEEVSSGEQDGTYEVHIAVRHEEVARLQEFLSAGDVEFRFALAYPGLAVEEGKVIALAEDSLRSAVAAALDSQQTGSDAPIFQAEKSASEREFRKERSLTIAAQSDAVARMLAGVTLELFSEPEWRDLDGADPAFLEAVAGYLEPILQEHELTTTTENTTTRERTRTLEVNFGLGRAKSLLRFGFSPKTEETLKKKYGVIVKETEVENHYKPHRVAVYQLRDGWEQAIGRAVSFAYRAVGVVDSYQPEDILPADFTADQVADEVAGDDGAIFAEIPLGAAFCYFGAGSRPPPGFSWASGKSKWPREAWVPSHLRGELLPNLDDRLMAGTTQETLVGQVWDKSVAYLPEQKTIKDLPVEGSNFMLKGHVPGTVKLSGRVEMPFIPNSDYPVTSWLVNLAPVLQWSPNRPGEAVWAHGPRVVSPSPEVHLFENRATVGGFAFPESERRIDLSGAESNPRHVKCRWIVRVR